jgi:hypothetical protein
MSSGTTTTSFPASAYRKAGQTAAVKLAATRNAERRRRRRSEARKGRHYDYRKYEQAINWYKIVFDRVLVGLVLVLVLVVLELELELLIS